MEKARVPLMSANVFENSKQRERKVSDASDGRQIQYWK